VNSKEFSYFRRKLNKTQVELAQLLGTSLKTVHRYEQGWRPVPVHVERLIFFLIAVKRPGRRKKCWVFKKCPPVRKKNCPAWEFKAESFCWFVNGTICEGKVQKTWTEKMKTCRNCEVFQEGFSIP